MLCAGSTWLPFLQPISKPMEPLWCLLNRYCQRVVAILLRLVGGTKKDTFCNGVFIRMEIRGVSNTKTVKNPRSGQIFSLEPLCTSRESTTKKVAINRLYVQLSLCCLNKFCFFVNGALISFILKCYPFFRVNFLYLEVVSQFQWRQFPIP